MRIMKPLTIWDADVLSTDVTDADYDEWNTPSHCIISAASPAIVQLTSGGSYVADAYQRGAPIYFSGTVPAGMTAGTTYYVGNTAGPQSTFKLYTDAALTTVVNTSGSPSSTALIYGPQHYANPGARVQISHLQYAANVSPITWRNYGSMPYFALSSAQVDYPGLLADGVAVTLWSAGGTLPDEIVANEVYYIVEYKRIDEAGFAATFRLAREIGGSAIICGGGTGMLNMLAHVHGVYELIAADTGTDYVASSPLNRATTTSADWALVSSTNRWRMFDQSIGSQTSKTNSFSVSIQAADYTDTIALLQLEAQTVGITITSPTDGIVYNVTHDVMDYSGIVDEWAYCFLPVELKQSLILPDLPIYPDCVIDITFTNTGSTAKCGACLIGQSMTIGGAQYGASVGIQDYSVKSADNFGNYQITERAFSKRASLEVIVENNYIDKLQAMLSEYRATPCLYIGADDYEGTVIYGFYKDFSVLISYPTHSICSIQLEGLT